MQDRRNQYINHLWETVDGESNGHVPDDVKVVSPKALWGSISQ